MVQALALCHNVTPAISEDGKMSYQASSPDEVAIVRLTQSVGLTLVFRDVSTIRIQASNNSIYEYEILEMFPFTSETKRMGVIVREKATDEILFYMKGADVVVAKIVQFNDWYECFFFISI